MEQIEVESTQNEKWMLNVKSSGLAKDRQWTTWLKEFAKNHGENVPKI